MNSCCFVNRVIYLGIRAMFRWHPFSYTPFIQPYIAGHFGNFISHSLFLSRFSNLSITGCHPHHLSQISLNSVFSPATIQIWYQYRLSDFNLSSTTCFSPPPPPTPKFWSNTLRFPPRMVCSDPKGLKVNSVMFACALSPI